MDGKSLIAYLLAEGDWIASESGGEGVQPGQIVVDVGAHVGTFTARALMACAAKVLAVEPDPVNVECLHRNFRKEIAAGRVIILPQGAWSSESTLRFHIGVANSGSGGMITEEEGAESIDVPVLPLDRMVKEAGLERVDFIKFDIEGAEREALKGARETLARWHPALMIDTYHLPDDPEVLPNVIRAANSSYQPVCGPCGLNPNFSNRVVPHVTFYH